MDSWVYLFSKFTHEALLFEALALLLGVFGYAIFFLIRRRRYGVAGTEVPSNVMKAYLAQLMGDAQEIRTQLFGLLGHGEAAARVGGVLGVAIDSTSTGAPVATAGAANDAAGSAPDPRMSERMKELEKKLNEQANALDSVLNEKMKLEELLANAKTEAPPAPTGDGSSLQDRVKQLEAQLAEYAVIEDDLANLKRLQKENKTLKQQIADAGHAPATAAAASPVAPEEKTAAHAEKATPAEAAAPHPAEAAISTEAVKAAHPHDPNHPADFESLVDVVEKNLAEAAKSAKSEASAGAAPTPEFQPTSGQTAEGNPHEKSEEQLQADFEKMLKG